MKHQLELPTAKYIVLNIITLGLYFFIFQIKVNKIIKYMALVEDYNRIYNAMTYSIGYLFIGFGMILSSFELFGYLGIVAIAYALLNRYIWVNQVRKAISYHVEKTFRTKYETNFWLAMIFPGLYLTWAINHMYDDI